jgi:hypothetical protein
VIRFAVEHLPLLAVGGIVRFDRTLPSARLKPFDLFSGKDENDRPGIFLNTSFTDEGWPFFRT